MSNELFRRKNIRLKEYDYSQNGYYFITICTYNRQKLFSCIVGAGSSRPNVIYEDSMYMQIELTAYGEIIKQYLSELPLKYPDIKIDKYVIMPNHIHLILILHSKNGRDNPAPTIG